jgi:hypothetical protein
MSYPTGSAVPAPFPAAVSGMLRADTLVVVHHDDTVSRFTDVTYTLGRTGLRVRDRDGSERVFARHDVLTTHVVLAHRRARRSEQGLAA